MDSVFTQSYIILIFIHYHEKKGQNNDSPSTETFCIGLISFCQKMNCSWVHAHSCNSETSEGWFTELDAVMRSWSSSSTPHAMRVCCQRMHDGVATSSMCCCVMCSQRTPQTAAWPLPRRPYPRATAEPLSSSPHGVAGARADRWRRLQTKFLTT